MSSLIFLKIFQQKNQKIQQSIIRNILSWERIHNCEFMHFKEKQEMILKSINIFSKKINKYTSIYLSIYLLKYNKDNVSITTAVVVIKQVFPP